jgi:sec-independent protein translocase protein TatA
MGLGELLLILIIFLVVFGGGRLPEIGRGLGEGLSNFKDSLRKGKNDVNDHQKPRDR